MGGGGERAVHQQHVCYYVCVYSAKGTKQSALWHKVLPMSRNVPLVTISAHVAQLIQKSKQHSLIHLILYNYVSALTFSTIINVKVINSPET